MGIEQELWEIRERGSFQVFNSACEGITLGDFQSVVILMWLYFKRGGFLIDPGMGKTVIISVALSMLKKVNRNNKCLFFIKKAQITQTSNDVRKYAGLRVVTCTGEREQIENNMWFRDTSNYDVLMITHEALDSDLVSYYLYENIARFSTCVVDEAHYLLNYKSSDRAFLLSSILPRFERLALLTATPMISREDQMAWFLYLIDKEKFAKVSSLTQDFAKGRRADLAFPENLYTYSRADVGLENTYNVIPVWVKPHDFQRGVSGANILQKTRGPGSSNQSDELIRTVLINKFEKKKGVVFCWYHTSWQWLDSQLKQTDIKYARIDSNTSQGDRDVIQAEFASNLLDIVVISVTSSINLDADYVYLYEFTGEAKQIIGRAERGLNPKVIDVYIMFTLETGDSFYFLNAVYKVSEIIRRVIGKEYTEFLKLGDEIIDGSAL